MRSQGRPMAKPEWAMRREAIMGHAGLILRPTERLVMLVLQFRENNERQCWPGMSLIVKETGLHEATVHRILKTLAEKGCIDIHYRTGKSSVYTIRMERFVDPPAPRDPELSNEQLRKLSH